ncbi:MAG: group II intron reverse transcriptase/maturase [bacterium]
MPIVVTIGGKVKPSGAKGHYCKQVFNGQDMDRIEEQDSSTQEQVERLVNPSGKKRKDMTNRERVQMLQRKLYLSAKQDKRRRFYVLYDKVFLDYILRESWQRVKSQGGSPGIDGQDFAAIEQEGVEQFLTGLKEELRTKTYKPSAVRRIYIPKPNGEQRPLGIPTVKDRVAQMACKLVIEPIFEADFEDSSYGFRPKKSAQDAIIKIKEYLQTGYTEVYDADLSKYFDTIPHDKLMKTLALRISDPRILELIKKWLKAPVYENGRYTGGRTSTMGTPQGGVISPLLANIYLHLLDRIVTNLKGIFAKAGIRIVRYADDFVLMGRTLTEAIITKVHEILNRMELRINEKKSRCIDARKISFHFLGFTIRYDRSIFDGTKRFWHIKPSDKACKRMRQNINLSLKRMGHYPPKELVKELNWILRGWLNYFEIQGVSYTAIARRKLNWYLRERLPRYFNRKSQRKTRLYRKQAFTLLVNNYGLIDPLVFHPAT